tara:strand:- start:78 stop:440 length:363 start_codon:yes stop_codon:yes gene_type:complete
VSLVARHLEANGIPTVVVGSARDIVEYCGAPRFVFLDFPLGNPSGEPWKRDMQRDVMGIALGTLEGANEPMQTVETDFVWPDPEWRGRYNRLTPEIRARLKAEGDARRDKQNAAKALRQG